MRSSGSGHTAARKMSVPVRALSVPSPKTATSGTRGHSASDAGIGGSHVPSFDHVRINRTTFIHVWHYGHSLTIESCCLNFILIPIGRHEPFGPGFGTPQGVNIQDDSLARGPKLLSIKKTMLLR